MIHFLAKFALSILGLLIIASYVPGIHIDSTYIAIVVAVIFGVLGVTVRPILFILTLPITIITFGLFALVINAFLFWFVASFVDGFTVLGVIPALIGAVTYTVLLWIIDKIL